MPHLHAHVHPHGHAHEHGHAHADDRRAGRRSLGWALAATVAFGAAQAVGATLLGSVALLADAAHNLSDGFGIGIALLAAWAATRQAGGRRTYGWARVEILAAFANGIALVLLGLVILVEAVGRLSDPPAVDGGGVAVFGAIGIAANGVPVLLMLRARRGDDLNLEGALRHAAGDVLASAGTLVAGLLVLAFGWRIADPLTALVVSVLVIASSWTLIRRPLEILLEQAPRDVDPDAIGRAMATVDGVRQIHDLHVWTITSGFPALSAHALVAPGADTSAVLHALRERVRPFGIEHTTIQVDVDRSAPLTLHRPGCPDAPRARTAPLHRSATETR